MGSLAGMGGMWEELSEALYLPGGSQLVLVDTHKCRALLQSFSPPRERSFISFIKEYGNHGASSQGLPGEIGFQ